MAPISRHIILSFILGSLFAVASEAAQLQSALFSGDGKLEAAAVSDPAHIAPGQVGEHVRKIQQALIELDEAVIDPTELQKTLYGPSTAKAVLAYKTKRQIIGNYQKVADDIVGKMTIAKLDEEMRVKERGTFRPEEIKSILGPPVIEPIPGSDAVAPDGFIIPIPKFVRLGNGRSIGLEQARIDVFKSGPNYFMVIDNLAPSHPNAQAAASAAAQAAAKRATSNALKRIPDVERSIISFGVGKMAGGLVSVIGLVLDPSPIGREIIWDAVIDGKNVRYTVLTPS